MEFCAGTWSATVAKQAGLYSRGVYINNVIYVMDTVLKYEQSVKEIPRRSEPPWGLRVRGWEGSSEE